jgi:hypothetical protein
LSKSFSLKVDIIDNHAFNEITKSKKKKEQNSLVLIFIFSLFGNEPKKYIEALVSSETPF